MMVTALWGEAILMQDPKATIFWLITMCNDHFAFCTCKNMQSESISIPLSTFTFKTIVLLFFGQELWTNTRIRRRP